MSVRDKNISVKTKWQGLLKEVLSKSRKGRVRAKVNAMEHDLTSRDLEMMMSKQYSTCPYTSVKLRFTSSQRAKAGDRKRFRNLSVDRILSSFGYTRDNVQLVTKAAQKMKGELSPQEFIAICRRIADVADMKELPRMSEADVDTLIDQF